MREGCLIAWLVLLALAYQAKAYAAIRTTVRSSYTAYSVNSAGGSDGGLGFIPSTNVIDWLNLTGVKGGIPYRSTFYTGYTDSATLANIQTGLNNASTLSNRVVLLTNGNYTLTGTLSIPNYVTLRGESKSGVVVTIDNEIAVGDTGFSRQNILISSGSTKDSTSVVLASAPSDLNHGSIMVVTELNRTNYVWPYGYELSDPPDLIEDKCDYCDDPETPAGDRTRGQVVMVTSVSGTTVNFEPALQTTFDNTPRVSFVNPLSTYNVKALSGIENMTIVGPSTSGNCIWFQGARDCWVSNVYFQVRVDAWPAVKAEYAYRITVDHCDFRGFAENADGVLFWINSGFCRGVNNWFDKIAQVHTRATRSFGHAWVYNYEYATTNGSTALISTITEHGSHTHFNLDEGNKTHKIHYDSIHGSGSSTTAFRNWVFGEVLTNISRGVTGTRGYTTFGEGCINIDSWHYHMNVVGNVLGHPGLPGAWLYKKTAPWDNDSVGDAIYAWHYSGYATNTVMSGGTNSYITALVHGNYDYDTDDTVWDAGIADHDIPNTLIFTNGVPGFFGSLAAAFPPIGPDRTGLYTNEIPAEYRFWAGTDP